ncbi:cytochrome P450 [Aspergillus unguis]
MSSGSSTNTSVYSHCLQSVTTLAMSTSTLSVTAISPLCASAAAGALIHWTYFVHGEHHLEAPWLFRIAIAAPVLIALGLWQYTPLDAGQAAVLTAQLVGSFYAALYTSIVLYRVLFHRLKRFPGPSAARVSKLWHVWRLGPRSDNFMQLDSLRAQYGDYVRTGPSEITIFNADAVPVLLGPSSKCTKAPWYDANHPVISLHTLRGKKSHDARRRIWDRGFGVKALRTYEDRITSYSRNLLSQLTSRSGQSVSAADWFHFYSFDVMGDVAFGRSFEMLRNGEPHFAFDLLKEGMRPLGLLGPVPWAFCLLTSIPGLGGGFKRFVAWSAEQVEKRRGMQMDVPDLMSWLIEASETADKSQHRAAQSLLESDSRLIIVAGSDTTASTLTFLFYHLAKDTELQEKFRQELSLLQEADENFSFKALQNAELLNGIINETLRLHPPVPSGVLRLTPPGGITIGETFIPGDTTVVAPTYTLGRLESCYEKADEFIPERWSTKPELVRNKAAFAPFSLGSFSCVGKQVALMELRMTTALLVSQMDIRFAPGENGQRLLNESKDFFTMSIAGLDLVFTSREH